MTMCSTLAFEEMIPNSKQDIVLVGLELDMNDIYGSPDS